MRRHPTKASRLRALLVLCALRPTHLFAPHSPLQARHALRPSLRLAPATAAATAAVFADPPPPVAGVVPDKAPTNKHLKKLWVAKRSAFIWYCIASQALSVFWLKRRRLRGAAKKEANRVAAARLRDQLIVLGPTFIKIGQLLSTRVDVLPPEVIQELARL